LVTTAAFSQPANDTLVLNYPEAEAVFLQRNLRLLAGELEIDEAKATVLQAKLWPNPTLSIGEVNPWSNRGAEQLGHLLGNWGNHFQLAVEIEQLIQTAAKRRKLIAVEQTGVLIAEEQFAELLRSLKVEFRTRLAELDHTQQRAAIYQQARSQLQQLMQGYQRQVQQGHVSQSEYLRLRALEADLAKNIADIAKENQAAQQAVKVLMGVAPQYELVISHDSSRDVPLAALKTLHAATILEWAQTNSTELRTAQLEKVQAAHRLSYEKAQRVPDLAVHINYDRGGNIMRDFVGVGLSMDIPFFQRNQGNIRAAQATVDRSRLLAEHKENEISGAAIQAWKALQLSIDQQEQLGDDLGPELDTLQHAYHHNFAARHISLLEYLDFLDAYLAAKDHILENQMDIYTHLETLRYHVGDQLPLLTKTDD